MTGGGACMVGEGAYVAEGMHGRGACMAGGMHGRGHAWQGGGMHGRGARAWRGEGGSAWQEKRQLQRAVHILLECILV